MRRLPKITADIVRHGGVVTWDVPHDPTGRISDAFMRQLKAIGEAVQKVGPRPQTTRRPGRWNKAPRRLACWQF